jgi:hypothetical protein
MADDDAEKKPFKRLNFFKGLLTSESDWMDGQEYRIGKHRLHNRCGHAPGVVRRAAGGLMVLSRGDRSVEVQPGYAIDGQGRELWLPEVEIVTLHTDDMKTPEETFYVVLRFVEEPVDFIAYRHNLAIRGHRRLLETSQVAVIARPPKIADEVELARVQVTKGAKLISDAKEPWNPQQNEIDFRFCPIAGSAGSDLDVKTRALLSRTLANVRKAFVLLARVKYKNSPKYACASHVISAAATLLAMNNACLIDSSNLAGAVRLVLEPMAAAWTEVRMYEPDLLNHPELVEFLKQATAAQALFLSNQARAPETRVKALEHLHAAADCIHRAPLK